MPHFELRGSFQFNGQLLIGRIRETPLNKKLSSCPAHGVVIKGSYPRVFWSSPISRFQILCRNAMSKLRSCTPSLGLLQQNLNFYYSWATNTKKANLNLTSTLEKLLLKRFYEDFVETLKSQKCV